MPSLRTKWWEEKKTLTFVILHVVSGFCGAYGWLCPDDIVVLEIRVVAINALTLVILDVVFGLCERGKYISSDNMSYAFDNPIYTSW